MPELPEVETVRRMLATAIPGQRIVRAEVSNKRLRTQALGTLPKKLERRVFAEPRRTGKFLLLDFADGDTLLSHLGMSGRWLWYPKGREPDESLVHVHLKLGFERGGTLWYEDVRRFGMLRVVERDQLSRDASLKLLGPDPLAERRDGEALRAAAHGARTSIKSWLLDQRKIAGVGNIYASEVLFRTRIHPARLAGRLTADEWARLAIEIPLVLEESIARMGTTFSTYRTIWNEPGQYGDQLLVYDRKGEPCRACGTPIVRMVQTGRATYLCPTCQPRRATTTPKTVRPKEKRLAR
ncbi:MAG: bifunctional DNA-formamidopyrimidine glycosylase/DNA-(apurinic or apyrimidinic site) lyase [Candidatus Eisenbacteria bacterium]|nr:bifunctional DNA-formamidopyrimidine glycosylase/DNA-(apurinic or apyrimidinic site) lyase [Candidatus Eisenbacteria bacterium]